MYGVVRCRVFLMISVFHNILGGLCFRGRRGSAASTKKQRRYQTKGKHVHKLFEVHRKTSYKAHTPIKPKILPKVNKKLPRVVISTEPQAGSKTTHKSQFIELITVILSDRRESKDPPRNRGFFVAALLRMTEV